MAKKIVQGTPIKGYPYAYHQGNGRVCYRAGRGRPRIVLEGNPDTSPEAFKASYRTAREAEKRWVAWFHKRVDEMLHVNLRKEPG
jgi:hypothetical protein